MENIDKRPNNTLSKVEQMKARKEQTEKEIQQLENRQKMLLNKIAMTERKARTRRLIQRGAILESVFPSITPLSNEKVASCLSEISWLPEVRRLPSKLAEAEDVN